MQWLSLAALALALAMDAFAVAIVTGLSLSPLTGRRVFRLSFHFGLFQALMPILGWAAGAAIYRHLAGFDHWVAFGLLAFIGAKMIAGATREQRERKRPDPTRGWDLVLLSIATSVDALAVGLSLALVGTGIVVPAVVIGIVAAGMTILGMLLGRRLGILWGKRVEMIGGLILIFLGLKLVLDHL